jgi:hypothetical protein
LPVFDERDRAMMNRGELNRKVMLVNATRKLLAMARRLD